MYNVIWIVTDSARTFSTGGLDDRDRPAFYDQLNQDFSWFRQAVTSAPSSVMSGAAMLTGVNSYNIGRNYNDFRYDKNHFIHIGHLLEGLGYETASLFVARELREKLGTFITQIPKKYWSSALSHRQKKWSNEEANITLDNFLSKRSQAKPLFLFFWNDIRKDSSISNNLAETLSIIKSYGYYENSIIIFCSDHGYPHPRRGFTPEYVKRVGLTHDLLLGDDNILVPLYIKVPGRKPNAIEIPVATVDIAPTILDFLSIDPQELSGTMKINGMSLKKIMAGDGLQNYDSERYIRTDCRFFGQEGRKTAIRSGCYKYVVHHDDGSEELFDLKNDPDEDNNLIFNKNYLEVVNKLRRHFQLEEESAFEFQLGYIANKLKKKLDPKDTTLLISRLPEQFDQILYAAVEDISRNDGFTFLDKKSSEDIEQKLLQKENKKFKFDKIIVVQDCSILDELRWRTRFETYVGKINILLDINFKEVETVDLGVAKIFKAGWSRKEIIKDEPLIIFTYFLSLLRRIFKRIF